MLFMKRTMKILPWTLALLFLIFDLFLVFKINTVNAEMGGMISDDDKTKDFFAQRIFMHMDYANPFKVGPGCSLEDRKGARLHLSDLLSPHKRLFFRFSKLNCETCIDHELGRLQRFLSIFPDSTVIMLADGYNLHELANLSAAHRLSCPLFLVEDGTFQSSMPAKANIPFYFTTDTSAIARHIFFPDKNFDFLTDQYYELAHYIFKQQGQMEYHGDPSNGRTRVELDRSVIDLGTLKKGDSAIALFTIKNTGDHPLIISDIKTSCGCTGAEAASKKVDAGQSTVLKVRFNAQTPGFFNKNVLVTTNASNLNPCNMYIRGMVK